MVGGPGFFRFFIQPTVAIVLGVLHGLRDQRAGRVREGRAKRLAEGVRAIAVPLVVALVAAFTFQYVIRSRIFVGYGLLYATVFVLIPYLIARGLAQRLAGRRTAWTHETRNPV
jgi:hypothetical protein